MKLIPVVLILNPPINRERFMQFLNQRLQKTKVAFDELINHDIVTFNKQLNDLDMHIDIEKKMEKSN